MSKVAKNKKLIESYVQDNMFCEYCMLKEGIRKNDIHVHHIFGGRLRHDYKHNIILLCVHCHMHRVHTWNKNRPRIYREELLAIKHLKGELDSEFKNWCNEYGVRVDWDEVHEISTSFSNSVYYKRGLKFGWYS